MELRGKKINFLGDSITEGVGASQYANCYVEVLTHMAGLAAGRNYGIGGTRFAKQEIPSEDPRFDLDFGSRVEEMDPDADLVVVFGGTNDYGHGDAALGTFSDRTPDTFYGACHALMRSLIEKYLGKPLVILTPLHRLDEDGDSSKQPLADYVQAEKEVAAYYGLPVLDLYTCSGMQPAVPAVQAYLMPDGLHPSDAGHALLAERIYGFLKAL